MMQAIKTKYLGPTNFRGSRIKAQADAGSIIIEWDDGLNVDDNHRMAAKLFIKKRGWNNVKIIGVGSINHEQFFILGSK